MEAVSANTGSQIVRQWVPGWRASNRESPSAVRLQLVSRKDQESSTGGSEMTPRSDIGEVVGRGQPCTVEPDLAGNCALWCRACTWLTRARWASAVRCVVCATQNCSCFSVQMKIRHVKLTLFWVLLTCNMILVLPQTYKKPEFETLCAYSIWYEVNAVPILFLFIFIVTWLL